MCGGLHTHTTHALDVGASPGKILFLSIRQLAGGYLVLQVGSYDKLSFHTWVLSKPSRKFENSFQVTNSQVILVG